MTLCDPDAARFPLQAPAAAHPVAFVDDQVRVTDPLTAESAAELVSDTVGIGGGAEPPPPPPPPPQPPTTTSESANATNSPFWFTAPPCSVHARFASKGHTTKFRASSHVRHRVIPR